MRSYSDTIIDALSLVSIAVLGLLLTLFLLPPLEQSRRHARNTQAWHTTRKLAAESDAARREAMLANPDPWGAAVSNTRPARRLNPRSVVGAKHDLAGGGVRRG